MSRSAKVLQFDKPIRRKINLRTPMGKVNRHWVEVVHERDPKAAILEAVGKVTDDLVQFSRILVAVYKPPIVEKTKGGIILTQSMTEDDIEEYHWQGKVGLIVAMGPQAYVDDDTTKFNGTQNRVGDWVWFRPSDGDAVEVNEVFCRIFDSERFIKGRIPHPDFVW
jgi:co-chaperonin GroES (HSP10)